MSLAEAREKAADARRMVGDHIDPREARHAAAVAAARTIDFDTAAKEYIAALEPGWKNAAHACNGGHH